MKYRLIYLPSLNQSAVRITPTKDPKAVRNSAPMQNKSVISKLVVARKRERETESKMPKVTSIGNSDDITVAR